MEWQPIDTFPRDGREMKDCVFWDGELILHFALAFWADGKVMFRGDGGYFQGMPGLTHWFQVGAPDAG